MRRWTLLLAGAALWLFLAALPALADGGPHVAAMNSGASTLTADSCAGCHRAHTAQGQYLITAPDEETLCLTCHGAQASGATTDVITGVQYTTGAQHDNSTGTGIQLGALRAGGFEEARLGDPARILVGTSFKTQVTVGGAVAVTSAHLDLAGAGIGTEQHIAWGNGINGSGAGPTVSLECTNCHNPHGNGNYRILNPLPTTGTPSVGTFTDPVSLKIKSVDGATDTVTTWVGHPYSVGDLVTIASNSGTANNTAWTVVNVPDGTKFQVGTFASGGITLADLTTGTGGTVNRTSAPVADSPLGTFDATSGTYPTKNYTVIQAAGDQSAGTGFLFYASQVTSSSISGDYWHRQVPWTASSGSWDDAPNGQPNTLVAGPSAGEVAFNIQITAWCSSCHSRYFSNQNPNPTGIDVGSSSASSRTIGTLVASTGIITTVTSGVPSSHGFVVGDTVSISDGTNNGTYTVLAVPLTPAAIPSPANTLGSPVTFKVAGLTGDTTSGTVIRTSAPQAQSSWWFPRKVDATTGTATDNIFKYQHRTVPNRACTTCHVAHGTNVEMTGAYSSTVPLPNDVRSSSSRLLKIDNRGTCQGCHDPSGTYATAGIPYQGPALTLPASSTIASASTSTEVITTSVDAGRAAGEWVWIQGSTAKYTAPGSTSSSFINGVFRVRTAPSVTTFTLEVYAQGAWNTMNITTAGTAVGTVTRMPPLP